MSERTLAPETLAARALDGADAATGAVVPPLHAATTYARDADYQQKLARSYSRYGGPTVDQAEQIICALEGGEDCAVFSSGMAAIAALMDTLPAGAHVVAPQVMYWQTPALLGRLAAAGRLSVSFCDQADPAMLQDAIVPGETALVWVETPANPVWDVVDLRQAAAFAHAAGARLAVDSTTASPVVTRPIEHGADIVMHSVTKYLNGHSDVLGGALVARRRDDLWQPVRETRDLTGAILAPFEAWLLIRGLRTVYVRVRHASATALGLARHFEHHAKVEKVLYPGLQSHPGHAIARRQMDTFGGMLSVCVKGGLDEAGRVIRALKVFLPATSLGGVESLAEHRKVIEGPDSPVADNLIRLSIGLEAPDDLIADLEQALEAV